MLDSARDLYLRSSMSEIDYQEAVATGGKAMEVMDGNILQGNAEQGKIEHIDQQMDKS